jgi:hypothetical protein
MVATGVVQIEKMERKYETCCYKANLPTCCDRWRTNCKQSYLLRCRRLRCKCGVSRAKGVSRRWCVNWQQVTGRFAGDVEALRSVHAQLQQEFWARMAAYGEQVQALWQTMRSELDLSVPQLDDYPLPSPIFTDELEYGLYDSARDYLEQIEAYKQFQGKLS